MTKRIPKVPEGWNPGPLMPNIGKDRHPKAGHKTRHGGSGIERIIKRFKSGGYSKTKA